MQSCFYPKTNSRYLAGGAKYPQDTLETYFWQPLAIAEHMCSIYLILTPTVSTVHLRILLLATTGHLLIAEHMCSIYFIPAPTVDTWHGGAKYPRYTIESYFWQPLVIFTYN